MSLRLVVGRAAAGKTGSLYAALDSAADQGRAAILVVPTEPDSARARAEFSSRRPLGVQVVTFDGLLESQWALYGDGRRLVSAAARNELCRRVAETATGNISGIAQTRGFQTVLSTLVQRAAGQTPSEGRDEHDFRLFLDAYQALLVSAGLVEPGEAALVLSNGTGLREACIAVNHFTDLATYQELLITGLAVHNDVHLALTWDEGFAPTEALDSLVARLHKRRAGIDQMAAPPVECAELRLVTDQMFGPTTVVSRSGAVELMEASGPEAEAALVARATAGLVREGFAPERIAVVFRNLAGRATLLEHAFNAEGVKAELDLAVPLTTTAFGRALLALLAAARGSGGREAVLAFLHSPYSGATPARVDELDATWRSRRVTDPRMFLRDATKLSSQTAGIVRAARRCVGGTDVSAATWQKLAGSMIATSRTCTAAHGEHTRLEASAYSRIVSVATDIESLTGSVDHGPFVTALHELIISSGSTDRTGFVQVTEAHRLRSRRYDAVIIGGLSAAEFSSEKPEPLAARILKGMGYASGTEETLSERYLFYLLVSRARSRLILARQASDALGQPLRPSTFWEEVVDLYRSPGDVLEGRQSALVVSDRLDYSSLADAAPALSPGRREARRTAETGAVAMHDRSCGRVPSDELLGGRDEFTVTELELYAACPQAWFQSRVVQPRELDTEFGAREKGALTHWLLATFYQRFTDDGHRRVDENNLVHALALLEAIVVQGGGPLSRPVHGLSEELHRRRAVRWAKEVIERDAVILEGFAPIAFEWAFGSAADRPVEIAGVSLRGKIDRIDVGRGLIVTDYKSGSVGGIEGFERAGALQVAVYARAAQRHLDAQPVAGLYRSLSSGALRGFWNTGVIAPEPWLNAKDLVGPTEVERMHDWAERMVSEAAAGMRSGNVEARPAFKDACSYCPVSPYCEKG